MGVDCLWLLPTFPSPFRDDGYDIADYYNIHPGYGTLDDFTVFLREAHVRGLKVITVGFVFANFAWRATLFAAINAKVPSPRVLSGTVRGLALILAAAMALDQIAVARTIVLTAFAIAFGAVILGLAIAFGVGGGGIARRILDHWFPERTAREQDEMRHL